MNKVEVGDQIGTSAVRMIGGTDGSTYVRIPSDVIKMYGIKPGQEANFFRGSDGSETVIRIADKVE